MGAVGAVGAAVQLLESLLLEAAGAAGTLESLVLEAAGALEAVDAAGTLGILVLEAAGATLRAPGILHRARSTAPWFMKLTCGISFQSNIM